MLNKARTDELRARMHNTSNEFVSYNTKDPSMAESLPFKDNNKAILAIDSFLKVTVIQLDVISTKIGINIEKSQELTTKWENIKVKLDAYIKSLDGVNYKKAFTYLGCTAAIIYFTYQMVIYRKLPVLMLSITSNIPMPNFSGKDMPVPKPSIESTFNKIMEVSLTPLTIVTGVGSIVTIMGILRASLWILRKLRK
jgi:hypothetical protein